MTNQLIRKGTFETNSSSSHCITIDDSTELFESLPVNDDGYVVLTGGEFGWGYEEYNDALTKANYIAVDYQYMGDDDSKYDILTDVIKEQTGCLGVVYDISRDSYIDHQSTGTGRDLNKDELRLFIFNPKSTLVISNDNGGW